jgi:hypothetical protein
VKRHLAFAALAVLFLSTTTAFGAKHPRSYSRAEVDRMIDQLRTELLAKIPPKLPAEPTPPQPITLPTLPLGYSKEEVDVLLAKLRANIEQNAVTKNDITQATRQFVTTPQLDDGIDHATKEAILREKDIEDKLTPPYPSWIPLAISIASLICSIGIPIWSRNTVQDNTTNRANALRDTAEDRARERVNEWPDHADDYASVMDLLQNIAPITEPEHLNLVARIGNFFNRLAADVSRGTTDANIITVSGLKRHAMSFVTALEPRPEQTIIDNLAQWDNLRQWQ